MRKEGPCFRNVHLKNVEKMKGVMWDTILYITDSLIQSKPSELLSEVF